METSKTLAEQNGNQSGAMLGELTGDELLVQNGNQAGSAMGELTDDELLEQNGNQAGVGVAEHYDELGEQPKILTFTANEDGSSVGFCCWSEDFDPVDMGKNMQYSTDDGNTWQDYTIGVGEENIVPISIDNGESVMFRGVNDNLAYYLEDDEDYIYTKCIIEGSVSAIGDVTSLLNGVGGDIALADNCYRNMFSGCTGLTTAPALPASTLASSCYNSMFSGCTGLITAPALPATTLASGCYNSMFSGCTGIVSHDVATLNNSQNTFQNNSSCASLTIHADTPPTIASSTIAGLKAGCIIYVPAASVDAYKAAQLWSARAAYIQAITREIAQESPIK